MISSSEEGFLGLEAVPSQYPAACAHTLISAQAAAHGDAVAISLGDWKLTYAELDEESTRLAASLQARGVGRGTVVGLLADRSPSMVVALLAILKAGGAYIPLDPSYPAMRLSGMLSLAEAALVLTETAVLARLDLQVTTPVLLLDAWQAGPARPLTKTEPAVLEESVTPGVSSQDTAYVIFTSGSTGEPKGVEITHGALVNLLWSLRERPAIGAGDTLLAVTSISFDIAAAELLLPLVVGARVEMATSEEAADPLLIMDKIDTCGITILQATPVTWRLLIGAGWPGNEHLRVWCGGEEMTPSLANDLLSRSGTVWNLYGPTETTIWSTACRLTSADKPVPLGEPLANTSLYVLDEEQNPVAPGNSGELYIGGRGLAKGYWKRPDLTRQSFPEVALGSRTGRTRLYRTGDRVRAHADGTIEFLGRLDRQVKLHGFRIELGEVEQAASTHPSVQEIVVTKVEDKERGDFLAAYVVPDRGCSLDVVDLRRHLAKTLPRFMVPSTLRLMERLPVTPNGKIDRKRLPAPTEQERLFVTREDAQEYGIDQERPGAVPPADLESRLGQLWRDALRLPSIGRNDNFFQMGGDSLLAAQLISKMARTFGRHCTLASLLQSPTIALYVAFLTGGVPPNYILLHQGSPEKRSETIFWMDNPDKLHHLAGLLDQPFYSMLLSAADLAAEAPEYPLERLATRMVKQILEHQRQGRFYIGGFCQNALLAYEVGQQLRLGGYDVPLLILVDPDDASFRKPDRPVLEAAVRRVKREKFHLSTMFRRPASDWLPYLRRRFAGIRFVLEEKNWQRRAQRTSRIGAMAPQAARELAQALFVSRLTYVPRPYHGRALFIEATLRPERDEQAARDEWNSLVSDPIWRHVTGEHLGLFSFPVVRTLSEQVRHALEDAATDVRV